VRIQLTGKETAHILGAQLGNIDRALGEFLL
jgi:hypothetical protein